MSDGETDKLEVCYEMLLHLYCVENSGTLQGAEPASTSIT